MSPVVVSAVWPVLMAWVLQSAVGEMWAQQAGLACRSHSASCGVSSYMSCYVACSNSMLQAFSGRPRNDQNQGAHCLTLAHFS